MRSGQLVEVARGYLGTPFHFGGRVKGVGVDCGGLLVCIARDAGMKVDDEPRATRENALEAIHAVAGKHAEVVWRVGGDSSIPSPSCGDILIFSCRAMPGHCGIFTAEGSFVHAHDSSSTGMVVETPLDERWMSRIVAVYRVREG